MVNHVGPAGGRSLRRRHRQRDAAADRIGAVPVPRHRLVDHDHAHRLFGVEVVEGAAAHERNADGGEVLRARHPDVGGRTPLGIVADAAFDVEADGARGAAAERHRVGDRRGAHAGRACSRSSTGRYSLRSSLTFG